MSKIDSSSLGESVLHQAENNAFSPGANIDRLFDRLAEDLQPGAHITPHTHAVVSGINSLLIAHTQGDPSLFNYTLGLYVAYIHRLAALLPALLGSKTGLYTFMLALELVHTFAASWPQTGPTDTDTVLATLTHLRALYTEVAGFVGSTPRDTHARCDHAFLAGYIADASATAATLNDFVLEETDATARRVVALSAEFVFEDVYRPCQEFLTARAPPPALAVLRCVAFRPSQLQLLLDEALFFFDQARAAESGDVTSTDAAGVMSNASHETLVGGGVPFETAVARTTGATPSAAGVYHPPTEGRASIESKRNSIARNGSGSRQLRRTSGLGISGVRDSLLTEKLAGTGMKDGASVRNSSSGREPKTRLGSQIGPHNEQYPGQYGMYDGHFGLNQIERLRLENAAQFGGAPPSDGFTYNTGPIDSSPFNAVGAVCALIEHAVLSALRHHGLTWPQLMALAPPRLAETLRNDVDWAVGLRALVLFEPSVLLETEPSIATFSALLSAACATPVTHSPLREAVKEVYEVYKPLLYNPSTLATLADPTVLADVYAGLYTLGPATIAFDPTFTWAVTSPGFSAGPLPEILVSVCEHVFFGNFRPKSAPSSGLLARSLARPLQAMFARLVGAAHTGADASEFNVSDSSFSSPSFAARCSLLARLVRLFVHDPANFIPGSVDPAFVDALSLLCAARNPPSLQSPAANLVAETFLRVQCDRAQLLLRAVNLVACGIAKSCRLDALRLVARLVSVGPGDYPGGGGIPSAASAADASAETPAPGVLAPPLTTPWDTVVDCALAAVLTSLTSYDADTFDTALEALESFSSPPAKALYDFCTRVETTPVDDGDPTSQASDGLVLTLLQYLKTVPPAAYLDMAWSYALSSLKLTPINELSDPRAWVCELKVVLSLGRGMADPESGGSRWSENTWNDARDARRDARRRGTDPLPEASEQIEEISLPAPQSAGPLQVPERHASVHAPTRSVSYGASPPTPTHPIGISKPGVSRPATAGKTRGSGSSFSVWWNGSVASRFGSNGEEGRSSRNGTVGGSAANLATPSPVLGNADSVVSSTEYSERSLLEEYADSVASVMSSEATEGISPQLVQRRSAPALGGGAEDVAGGSLSGAAHGDTNGSCAIGKDGRASAAYSGEEADAVPQASRPLPRLSPLVPPRFEIPPDRIAEMQRLNDVVAALIVTGPSDLKIPVAVAVSEYMAPSLWPAFWTALDGHVLSHFSTRDVPSDGETMATVAALARIAAASPYVHLDSLFFVFDYIFVDLALQRSLYRRQAIEMALALARLVARVPRPALPPAFVHRMIFLISLEMHAEEEHFEVLSAALPPLYEGLHVPTFGAFALHWQFLASTAALNSHSAGISDHLNSAARALLAGDGAGYARAALPFMGLLGPGNPSFPVNVLFMQNTDLAGTSGAGRENPGLWTLRDTPESTQLSPKDTSLSTESLRSRNTSHHSSQLLWSGSDRSSNLLAAESMDTSRAWSEGLGRASVDTTLSGQTAPIGGASRTVLPTPQGAQPMGASYPSPTAHGAPTSHVLTPPPAPMSHPGVLPNSHSFTTGRPGSSGKSLPRSNSFPVGQSFSAGFGNSRASFSLGAFPSVKAVSAKASMVAFGRKPSITGKASFDKPSLNGKPSFNSSPSHSGPTAIPSDPSPGGPLSTSPYAPPITDEDLRAIVPSVDLVLCRLCASSHYSELGQVLLKLFAPLNYTPTFLQRLIQMDVSAADHHSTLFRGNTFTTRLLTLYAQSAVGFDVYLREGLAATLQGVAAGESADSAADAILDTLFRGLSRMPRAVRDVCRLIHDEVAHRFPASALAAVGGFLFLRLINPVVISPESIGIAGLQHAKRAFVQISKRLQTLSNQVGEAGQEAGFPRAARSDSSPPESARAASSDIRRSESRWTPASPSALSTPAQATETLQSQLAADAKPPTGTSHARMRRMLAAAAAGVPDSRPQSMRGTDALDVYERHFLVELILTHEEKLVTSVTSPVIPRLLHDLRRRHFRALPASGPLDPLASSVYAQYFFRMHDTRLERPLFVLSLRAAVDAVAGHALCIDPAPLAGFIALVLGKLDLLKAFDIAVDCPSVFSGLKTPQAIARLSLDPPLRRRLRRLILFAPTRQVHQLFRFCPAAFFFTESTEDSAVELVQTPGEIAPFTPAALLAALTLPEPLDAPVTETTATEYCFGLAPVPCAFQISGNTLRIRIAEEVSSPSHAALLSEDVHFSSIQSFTLESALDQNLTLALKCDNWVNWRHFTVPAKSMAVLKHYLVTSRYNAVPFKSMPDVPSVGAPTLIASVILDLALHEPLKVETGHALFSSLVAYGNARLPDGSYSYMVHVSRSLRSIFGDRCKMGTLLILARSLHLVPPSAGWGVAVAMKEWLTPKSDVYDPEMDAFIACIMRLVLSNNSLAFRASLVYLWPSLPQDSGRAILKEALSVMDTAYAMSMADDAADKIAHVLSALPGENFRALCIWDLLSEQLNPVRSQSLLALDMRLMAESQASFELYLPEITLMYASWANKGSHDFQETLHAHFLKTAALCRMCGLSTEKATNAQALLGLTYIDNEDYELEQVPKLIDACLEWMKSKASRTRLIGLAVRDAFESENDRMLDVLTCCIRKEPVNQCDDLARNLTYVLERGFALLGYDQGFLITRTLRCLNAALNESASSTVLHILFCSCLTFVNRVIEPLMIKELLTLLATLSRLMAHKQLGFSQLLPDCGADTLEGLHSAIVDAFTRALYAHEDLDHMVEWAFSLCEISLRTASDGLWNYLVLFLSLSQLSESRAKRRDSLTRIAARINPKMPLRTAAIAILDSIRTSLSPATVHEARLSIGSLYTIEHIYEDMFTSNAFSQHYIGIAWCALQLAREQTAVAERMYPFLRTLAHAGIRSHDVATLQCTVELDALLCALTPSDTSDRVTLGLEPSDLKPVSLQQLLEKYSL